MSGPLLNGGLSISGPLVFGVRFAMCLILAMSPHGLRLDLIMETLAFAIVFIIVCVSFWNLALCGCPSVEKTFQHMGFVSEGQRMKVCAILAGGNASGA